MLLRYAAGERSLWSVVQVPTPEEEDARQLHRELNALKQETTEHTRQSRSRAVDDRQALPEKARRTQTMGWHARSRRPPRAAAPRVRANASLQSPDP
jgi:hypothetical protein